MDILIKSVRIIDQKSAYHNKEVDVLVSKGKIKKIGTIEDASSKTIEAKGMILSVGWFDMRANFCDPGLEYKEDLFTGMEAASAGGFTGVALLPNTKPVIQSKNDIKYIYARTAENIVDVYPMGAVTIDTKGEDFTEMIDLHEAGAIAFTDGEQPLWQSDILLKSLQYLEKFKGLLINKPEEKRLNMFGHMNEGVNSTILGMKGMPKLGEELMINRDLSLLEYAGGRLHLSQLSTVESIAQVRAAKKKGLNVTCDVAAFQALFDDSALNTFDTNYKVNPPFREKEDINAIIKGLKDGTIDVIVSSHTPHDEESKKLEFDLADFGITGLQTVAHSIQELAKKVDLPLLIEKLTTSPRNLLGLPHPEIAEGENANLTLFAPELEWTFDSATNKSKSVYSPYFGKTLRGKAVAVFNKGKVIIQL
ncbi:MAG: dihydroorotase [Cyclobacteriaceae bacterium]|nr:dihydroorotase [Cyclobacteriaceae bacterium]